MSARTVALAAALLALGAGAWMLAQDRRRADVVVPEDTQDAARASVELRASEDAPGKPERARVAPATTETPDAAVAAASADVGAEALLVDVVDARGAPVAGCAVELFDRGPRVPVAWGAAVSDERGRAAIAVNPARLARGVGSPAVAPRGAFAPGGMGVELWPLPAEPVRLVVPARAELAVTVAGAVGAVDVFVQHAAVHAVRGAIAADAAPASAVGMEHARLDGGEAAVFAVEAGAPLVVVARDAVTRDERVERPAAPAAGERLALHLAFDTGRAVLAGTLVAPEAELEEGPWRWTLFDLVRGRGEARPLVPGDGAAFRAALEDAELAEFGEPAWWVLGHGWWGSDVRAMVPLAGRRAHGVHDVGALDAAPPPLLAQGRVVTPSGEPWSSVTVRLLATASSAGAAALALGPRATTDREGRFELRGRVDPSLPLLACVAGADHEVPAACAEFRAGDRGIEIVAAEARLGVRGRVLFDAEAMAGTDVSRHLGVMSEALEDGPSVLHAIASDGTFAFPGTEHRFAVHLRSFRSGATLAIAEDPFGGVEAEPRDGFIEFDLRGRLRIARVQAVDAEGAPIAATAMELPDAGEHAAGGRSTAASPLELALFRPSHRVRFEAPGWRAVDVEELAGDRTVVFDRRELRVTLHWTARPAETPPQYAFRPWIAAVDASGNAVSAMRMDAEAGVFDERGLARAAVSSPGRYRVGLTLDQLNAGLRSSTVFRDWQQVEITVLDTDAEQRFEFAWDPTLAIDQMRREAAGEE